MNLFTYLLAKNDKFSLVHKGDLFSYLLGKSNSIPLKTAEGVYITIEALKTRINELKMTKESTQDGTPTPENPIEVKTVKGYRNLFDKDNFISTNLYVNVGGNTYATAGTTKGFIFDVSNYSNLTISKISSQRFGLFASVNYPTNGGSAIFIQDVASQKTSITYDLTNYNYIVVSYYSTTLDTLTEQEILDSIMINEGTEELPYVPYGNNYVAITNTNGTDTNYYTIPLNGNEIAGIGDYKDELIVDSKGKCWLNKKVGKAIFDGSESGWSKASSTTMVDRYVLNTNLYLNNSNSKCNYFIKGGINQNLYIWFNNNGVQLGFNFASYGTTTLEQWKEWLSTHNLILYQPLATPDPIDLNCTVDIRLFKGANNISNSDDMYMTLKYY